MSKIKDISNKIETFLQSDAGQRFFNIAFSVGAAIVIWGALFMILNLRGGTTLLCIGMGTEILMFLLTAFERPPKEPNWEAIVPALKTNSLSPVENLTIIDDTKSGKKRRESPNIISDSQNGEIGEATEKFVESLQKISDQMKDLQESMVNGLSGYAQQVAELNKNIAGLNSLYELQIKNVSGQLHSMDSLSDGLKDIKEIYEKSASESAKYFEETEKMTQYMKQINAVYAKMITAMKVES